MEGTAIATVVAITGQAYARSADGEIRELQPGDVLLQGETVVTPAGAQLELETTDGQPLVVSDVPELLLSADLVAERAPGADESAVQDETVQQVLAALESGEDLGEILDDTAIGERDLPSSGNHSFIRLGRIAEGTSEFAGIPGSFAYSDAAAFAQDEQEVVDAIDDAETTEQNTPVTVEVTLNDVFNFGEVVVSITQPENGVAVLNPDGTVTYTPNPGFLGQDTFTYTATDPAGNQVDTANVIIDVVGPIEPPPPVSYPHLRAHDTNAKFVCRLQTEKTTKVALTYLNTQ
ncbi:retention module-containing protein [Mangrovimicrobium sediminis]|uniref:Retention module-containing protein n=1 Tax=Mangrovimicrobium sediminis TaxID=2562682 RepID=A0A4Z0M324_9GAMM|nr:retention module-containing protein [Haliea sp. SAOS-164]TGD73856.1 retention module-containing protein [Haliea sp. SAOS-164]